MFSVNYGKMSQCTVYVEHIALVKNMYTGILFMHSPLTLKREYSFQYKK